MRAHPGESDLAAFDQLTDKGATAEQLRRALDLWRGEPLACVIGSDQLDIEIAHLRERRLQAAERWARVAAEAGQSEEMTAELARLVWIDPLRESLWGHLMLAHYRLGRRAAALEAYRSVHDVLHQELGVRPSRPLLRLRQRILAGDPVLATG